MGAVGVGIEQETSAISAQRSRPRRPRMLAAGLLLLLATVALYYPVHNHPFLNYDDRDYVTDNPHAQRGLRPSTVRWAFTTYAACNWHPLTWMSHALDC